MIKLEGQKRNPSEIIDKKKDILAVVYGKELKENLHITVNYNNFLKIFEQTGYSTIIELVVEGESYDVLVKDIQISPKEDLYSHIDFYAIVRGEELEVSVALDFISESPAVKKGAVLNTALTEVNVKAMPRNLPSELSVDLSKLENIGDT